MKIITSLFLTSFILIGNTACAGTNNNLDNWAKENTLDEEKLLCKLKQEEDFFLVARNGDKLKTAYKIDVTSSSGEPQAFVIRWRFQNEEDEYIGLNIKPEIIRSGYLPIDDKVYAEEVSYKHVSLDGVQKIKVHIGLKKYEPGSNVPSSSEFNDSDLLEAGFCEIDIR